MAPDPVTPVSASAAGGKDDKSHSSNSPRAAEFTVEGCCEEMSMDEIFNGKECYYPGLIPLVYAYLDYIHVDAETLRRIDMYLQFISKLVLRIVFCCHTLMI